MDLWVDISILEEHSGFNFRAEASAVRHWSNGMSFKDAWKCSDVYIGTLSSELRPCKYDVQYLHIEPS
jgi:hypothetical protein